MKRFLFLYLCLCLCSQSHAQKNGLLQLQLTGDTSQSDHFYSIIALSDGFVAVGKTASTRSIRTKGGEDALVVRYDRNGQPLWQKAFGGSANDRLVQVLATPDGGFLALGSTESDNGDVSRPAGRTYDAWLVKIASDGALQWQKALGGSRNEFGSSLVATPDGGYLLMALSGSVDGDVTGKTTTDNDIWLVKVDASGQLLQQRLYGGSGHEGGLLILFETFATDKYTLVSTLDGGYCFVTATASNDGMVSGNHGSRDMWVVKVDALLNLQWQKCLGGTAEDTGYGLLQLSDSSYIVTGFGYSNDGDIPGIGNGNARTGVVMRLKPNGEKEWAQGIGGDGIFYTPAPVQGRPDAFILPGFGFLTKGVNDHPCHGGGGRAKLLVMNKQGDWLWYRCVGGNDKDRLYEAVSQSDGSVVAAGASYSNEGDIPAYGNRDYYHSQALMIRVKELSLVKGHVFYDLNHNGLHDAQENFTPHRTLYIRHLYGANPYLLWYPTGDPVKGRFAVALDTGTYNAGFPFGELDPAQWIYKPRNLTFRLNGPGQKDSLNLIITPRKLVHELTTSLAGLSGIPQNNGGIFLNKEAAFLLYSRHEGGDSVKTARVQLVKDPRFRLVSSSRPHENIRGDTITWKLPVMKQSATDTIRLSLIAYTGNVAVGDTLWLQSQILDPTDYDSSNNTALHAAVAGAAVLLPDTTHTTLQHPFGLRWLRTLNGYGGDYANSVQPVADGGFLVAGRSYSINNDFAAAHDSSDNAFITRFTPDGRIVWHRMLKGTGGDAFHFLEPSTNGHFLAAGNTTSTDLDFAGQAGAVDGFVVKWDTSGNVLWKKLYGAAGGDYIHGFRATPDGGSAFLLEEQSTRGSDWLYKTGADGSLQWSRRVDSIYRAPRLARTPDGGYLVAGLWNSVINCCQPPYSYLIYKFDSTGKELWHKRLFAIDSIRSSFYVEPADLYVDTAGSIFILTDLTDDPVLYPGTEQVGLHGSADWSLTKLNSEGKRLWQRYYGGSGQDHATRIRPAGGNQLLLTGFTGSGNGNVKGYQGNYDGWLVRVDAHDGRLIWQRPIGGNAEDRLMDAAVLTDGDMVTVGTTMSRHSGDVLYTTHYFDALVARIGTSNHLSGTLYFDGNSNGQQEANEPLLSNIKVEVTKGPLSSALLTQNGSFSLSADTGAYVFRPVVDAERFIAHPLSDTVVFTDYGRTGTVTFGLKPNGVQKDLMVSLIPVTPARPGFESVYHLTYQNTGNLPVLHDTVVFRKDARQLLLRAEPAPSATAADSLSWIITDLPPMESRTIQLVLRNDPPPALNNGDSLKLTAAVYPLPGDVKPADNRMELTQIVRGSFDPNDKTEVHNGRLTPAQLLQKEALMYTIRFQNTGTDTAFRVIIRDTLEKNLDPASLQMIGASHRYTLHIREKTRLEWVFDHINLPDSNVNEPGSHGYVSFRIRPVAGLREGDSINNTASIYFDYNLPVVTNTSHTAIRPITITPVSRIDPMQQQIRVFPNPGDGRVWIRIEGGFSGKLALSLMDMGGRLLWQQPARRVAAYPYQQELDLSGRPAGVYLLQVQLEKKAYRYKLVVE